MLKVRKLSHRPWPVTVTLQECNEATGEVTAVEQTFVAHFKPFTEDDIHDADDKAKAAHPLPPDTADENNPPVKLVLKRNAVFFAELLCGWGPEVVDEKEKPIPYSPEALAGLVTGADGLAVSAGLNAAIFQIRFGAAPQKNSKTSPEPGPKLGEVAETSSPTT